MDDKQEQFLEELAELTKKYGIVIGGCGCCGSPWLNDDIEEIKYFETGYYVNSGQLEYHTVNDKYDEPVVNQEIKNFNQQVKELAYKIDPECWVSYSGKDRKTKQIMDARRLKALASARKKLIMDD